MNLLPELDIQGKIREIEEHRERIKSIKKEIRRAHRQKKPKSEKKSAQSKKVVGSGEKCHKCGETMVRKGHVVPPLKFHYVKWDVCRCGVVKHYEEFKSEDWKEYERQSIYIRSI